MLYQKSLNYVRIKQGQGLFNGFGYVLTTKGKTSGSRVAFVHNETQHIIMLHKPHPGNELKRYQIDSIIESLSEKGLIS